MRQRLKPFPELKGDQALASDPRVHAALSASAGTGKTQVLSARVLRLLLHGVRPEHILCLTFTKAGAAEMANRINARLATWVRMRDQDLRTDLINLGEANDPPTMQRARRLFAKILDAPGGLRIQTIHSFAQALLAAFPAEAGILPGFKPIEGRAEQELARTTLAEPAGGRGSDRKSGLIADVQCLSLRLGETGRHLLSDAVRQGGRGDCRAGTARVYRGEVARCDGVAGRCGRRLSCACIAPTTASIATCSRPSSRPIEAGAAADRN